MPRVPSELIPSVKGSLPLKWHGGKQYLADKIIGMMPEHVHYVEPYFGGGAVLFRKDGTDVSEVVNDLNGELVNFWEVLRLHCNELEKVLKVTPFSEQLMKESLTSKFETSCIDRARNFFIRYRQSRQGLGKGFATLTRNRTRRGMNEQVSSWLSAIDGLEEACERLKRVVILNKKATEVIKQQDGVNTLFYLDPPYLFRTSSVNKRYESEMSYDEHVELLNLLDSIKGKFLLSGYHSDMYDKWGWKNTYKCIEIAIPNHASFKSKKKIMIECIWSN